MFLVLLLMPTVGLDSVARDHLERHITRVNMQHSFKTAHKKIVKRVITRGLMLALVTKIIKLLFYLAVSCY